MHVTCGLGTGAGHLEQVASGRTQQTFRQMAAARITRAKDQDKRLHTRV
jgi:hypothetical protein